MLDDFSKLLGGRWRLVLIYRLLDGPKRYGDLLKITGISRRMLTVNLRVLEKAGLVSRSAYAEIPPRVEYGLTPQGMELKPVIDVLCAWSQKFKERHEKNMADIPATSPAE